MTRFVLLEVMSLILINCMIVVLIGSAFVICAALKEWFGIDLIAMCGKWIERKRNETKDI